MVKPSLNKKSMDIKIIPIFSAAVFAAMTFYILYAMEDFFNFYIFIGFFVFFLICTIGIILAHLLLRNRIEKVHSKKIYHCILFSFIGVVLALSAFFRLILFASPIKTLAEYEKIESIQAVLTSEAFPAGRKYYRVNAKLISCTYKNNAKFSASGNIKIFLPKEMVLQNNAYSVSVYKSRNKNACKNFSKGLTLSARGKIKAKKTLCDTAAFFIYDEVPEFIGWNSRFDGFRANLRFKLMRQLASWGKAGGLLLALLSANKDFLEKNCIQLFRLTGLAHILALSGMHVSLLALAAIQLGRIFGKKNRAVIFSLIAILAFVWFAGSAPSLNRALGMMIILIITKSLGLEASVLSILSLTFLIHLELKPYDALSMGFMLSYGALVGIVIIGKAVITMFRGKIPEKTLSGISASIGAQLFTAPIVIFKIVIIAPIGIIASIVISPIVSLFLIFGIPAVLIAFIFPFTGAIFSFILNQIYSLVIELSKFFALCPAIQAKSFEIKLSISILAVLISIMIFIYSKILERKKLCIY